MDREYCGDSAHKGLCKILEGGMYTDLEKWPQCPDPEWGHVSREVTGTSRRQWSSKGRSGVAGRDASAGNRHK